MATLRANFTASQGALQDVVDRIVDSGAVPVGLPTGETGGDAVRIGGFLVRNVSAHCSGSNASPARRECPSERVEVVFRITGPEPYGGSTTATYLLYCGQPECYLETGTEGDSVELGRHWAMGYEYDVVANLFAWGSGVLAIGWLAFLFVYSTVRLILHALERKRRLTGT
jgi:hypothetical protein